MAKRGERVREKNTEKWISFWCVRRVGDTRFSDAVRGENTTNIMVNIFRLSFCARNHLSAARVAFASVNDEMILLACPRALSELRSPAEIWFWNFSVSPGLSVSPLTRVTPRDGKIEREYGDGTQLHHSLSFAKTNGLPCWNRAQDGTSSVTILLLNAATNRRWAQCSV